MRCFLCNKEATILAYKGDTSMGSRYQLCRSCLQQNRRNWSVSCVYKVSREITSEEQKRQTELDAINHTYYTSRMSLTHHIKYTSDRAAQKRKDATIKKRKSTKNFSR